MADSEPRRAPAPPPPSLRVLAVGLSASSPSPHASKRAIGGVGDKGGAMDEAVCHRLPRSPPPPPHLAEASVARTASARERSLWEEEEERFLERGKEDCSVGC
ncbi:Os02g0737050 [Oryza sativa Japonica Group]|nr:Os02g0737050 [Oryza sativa Japonica Group]